MHDTAAPSAVEPAEPAPLLANIGFLLGFIGLFMVVTIKLSPLGYGLAVLGIVCSVLGGAQAAMQTRPAKIAIAGFFCALFAISLFLLARHHLHAMAGGRSAWPGFLVG